MRLSRDDQREENNLPKLNEEQAQGRMLVIDEASVREPVSSRMVAMSDKIFDVTTVDGFRASLSAGIRAPVKGVKTSTLGGPERISLIVYGSLDEKRDWVNGIFENSRYFKMILGNDGIMKLVSQGTSLKFRQSKVVDVDDAIRRINKYISDVESSRTAKENNMDAARAKRRLEYLRKEIEAERISYGEIQELQSLAEYIDNDDVLLLEWAGVKENSRRRGSSTSRMARELLAVAKKLM